MAPTTRCTPRRAATGISTPGSTGSKRICFSRRARAIPFLKRTRLARLARPPRWPKQCAFFAEGDARPLESKPDQYGQLVALRLQQVAVEIPERPAGIPDLRRYFD